MYYPPSLDSMKYKLGICEKDGVVVMPYEKLCTIIRVFLELMEVDEEWYSATYPDAKKEIADGVFSSAKEHFMLRGYFEGRLARNVEIDEAWYYDAYADVEEKFKAGGPSAQEHYIKQGYNEGRPIRLAWGTSRAPKP